MAAIRLKRTKLRDLLNDIHTHAEIASEEDRDQIVYREKDIIELLEKLKDNNAILNEGLEFEENKISN